MATEILINDGGAPARILPYTAGVALSAGEAVMASTTVANEVVLADTAVGMSVLGFALTDSAAGDMASIVTGKGVILNVQAIPGAIGAALAIGGAAAGQLAAATNATVVAVNNRFAPCAMNLKLLGEGGEALGVAGLWRVQTL
tara:strand:+ start:328 stop:756 length:429 start_codon:yes stop_codon:yes gene_type:complete